MSTNQKKCQLEPGRKLRSETANYEIIEVLGLGGYGETYLAKVIQIKLKSSLDELSLFDEKKVVIKIPTLDFSLPDREIRKRLAEVYEQFQIEYACMKRLHGLECVAQVLDCGLYQIKVDRGRGIPTLFSPSLSCNN